MDVINATDVISATDVSKAYGTVQAVRQLSLSVPEGQIVAVLGPNGAGKTTTIEMLLGLRRPDRGAIRLFGQSPDSAAARARVGSMLQDSDGPESLTVAETVSLVRHYYPYSLPVSEVLQRADLAAKAGSKIGQLSGGQRQRLSFALAIVGDPDLLFLDEPTAALDVTARAMFWSHVRDFAALGKTILFSSHNLAETDAVADRIVVISKGEVIADGTPSSIKAMVAGKTVRMVTDAAPHELERGDDGCTIRGLTVQSDTGLPAGLTRVELSTNEPERLLYGLFARGHQVSDLTVVDADLETAFVHLTSSAGQPDTHPGDGDATTRRSSRKGRAA